VPILIEARYQYTEPIVFRDVACVHSVVNVDWVVAVRATVLGVDVLEAEDMLVSRCELNFLVACRGRGDFLIFGRLGKWGL
jgi:hypothetical protein